MSDNKQSEEHHLKTETAPDAPELKHDSQVSKVAKKNKPWVDALAKFSRPLVALLVIVGLATVGYFGFIRSSADTNLSSSTPPTVTCGKKLTDKECKQKQAESDAAFYAQLHQDCTAANRIYSNNTCGGCQRGFVENGGVCKERKPINCDAQNRKQDGDYACGGCKDGYAQYDPMGACIGKTNCAALNRVNKTDFQCGDCVAGYSMSNGTCKASTDCKALNRVQTDPFTCGACLTGYSSAANTGVCLSNVAMANICAASYKNYNTSTAKCDTCLTGYKLDGTKCVRDTTVKLTKADCDNLHRTYNDAAKQCGGCVSGYTANADKVCISNDLTSLTCAAGNVVINNKCVASAEPLCDAFHKQYNKEKNTCRDACQAGYYLNATNACIAPTRAVEDPAVKATCDAAFKTYDKLTNKCTNTCLKDYYSKDGGKTCVPVPGKIDECKRDINGRCSADVAAVKAVCAGQHREYNDKLNVCRASCVDGFYTRDGVCKEKGKGKPETVKAGCEKLNLTYDAEANICKPNCKAAYTMRSGVCVPWEEASMTKYRCDALGRTWVPALPSEAGANAHPAYCDTSCPAGTVPVVATDPDNSFCKATALTAGIDGVDTDMTHDQCKAQNRAWIEALNACASRCKSGFYFSDNNKCEEVVPATDPNMQGTGDAGNGTTDGCQADLQPIRNGTLANDVFNASGNQTATGDGATRRPGPDTPTQYDCPDDSGPTTSPTETDGGKKVAHDVDTTLTHEACTLLGRQWVPTKENKKGEKVLGGCSIQACNNEDADIKPNKASGVPYCQGSVLRISHEKCTDLHRVWSSLVNGCLSNPNQDSTKPKVNAPQCQAPYTVLIRHTAEQGFDECVTPTTYERLKGFAQDTGRPVAVLASMPARGICNLRANMQWINGKCVKERVVSHTGGNSAPTGGNHEVGQGESKAPNGQSWSDFCGKLGRATSGNSCASTCKSSNEVRNPNNLSDGWDNCDAKSQVCSSYGTGGTKNCVSSNNGDSNGGSTSGGGSGGNSSGGSGGGSTNYPLGSSGNPRPASCKFLVGNGARGNCDGGSGITPTGDHLCMNQWHETRVTITVSGSYFRGTICALAA